MSRARPVPRSTSRAAASISLTACGLLLIGAAAASAPTAAHAAALAVPGCRTGADDFDGNGGTDVAIGGPLTGANGGPYRGQVDVRMAYPSGTWTVVIAPPTDAVRNFGDHIAEIDLSDHSNASTPCSALAISGRIASDPADDRSSQTGVVFVYTWDAAAKHFALLNTIRPSDGGAELGNLGNSLAAPTMPANTPAPRQPILYTGTYGSSAYPDNAVARLTLDAQGRVTDHEIITPGATANTRMPLTSASASSDFGSTLLGAPDPAQVIIGDPGATLNGHHGAGAVVVWTEGGGSQLITESTPGVPGGPETSDRFGKSVWLSTEVANDAHSPTYLFVGAPGESIGTVVDAGAAYQFTFDRNGAPAQALTTGVQFWSQDSPGVAGQPETGDEFGSSFQSFTSHGGAPKYVVGVPGESYAGRSATGVIDVLGDGLSFDDSVSGAQRKPDSYRFGTTLSAARNIDDTLTHDPFPAPALGRWSADLLVGSVYDTVTIGLPGGTVGTPRPVLGLCSGTECGFGQAGITTSGGG